MSLKIYKNNTANFPRNATDAFFDIQKEMHFDGCLNKSLEFITEKQLKDTDTWKLYVKQFSYNPDDEGARWRCEYWGKMMRGACFCYSYSHDKELFDILRAAVEGILNLQDADGRISTYSVEKEFDGWDIWGRKYVLLGMQYFIEICPDREFNEKIIDSMCRQADYMIEKIGKPEDGKLLITKLTRHWRGLNSSSVLEPFVRLYSITENKKYLDFAEYITDCGFTDVRDIISLAYENELHPYQYPVTKAYEMTSCFMGLLEYYRITGNEKHLKAILNFADRILEDEFTVIGSAGCTHELFDHSAVRQANPDRGEPTAQETCVTVTLMQFFYQLNLITGNPKYADAFERSLYNGYLGAINTEDAIDLNAKAAHPDVKIVPNVFDSYSPLTPGVRGNNIGGFLTMDDGKYGGCCICIGSAGIGLAMKSALLLKNDGVVLNYYERGTVACELTDKNNIRLCLVTDYPADGNVTISVTAEKAFNLYLRNPEWSEKTSISLNGNPIQAEIGYVKLPNVKDGDIVEISFDMRTKAVFPIPYGRQILMNKVIWGANYMVSTVDVESPATKDHIALRRGPLMLAAENRLGYSVDDYVNIAVDEDGFADAEISAEKIAPYPCLAEVAVRTADGKYITVTDYASAGKLYNEESKVAVWINNRRDNS